MLYESRVLGSMRMGTLGVMKAEYTESINWFNNSSVKFMNMTKNKRLVRKARVHWEYQASL